MSSSVFQNLDKEFGFFDDTNGGNIMSKTSRRRTKIVEFVLGAFLAVSIFVCFAAVFFFTVVSRSETSSVKQNTHDQVVDFFVDVREGMGEEDVERVGSVLKDFVQEPDTHLEDKQIREANRSLILQSIAIVVSILIFVCVIANVVWAISKRNASNNGVDNNIPDVAFLLVENMWLLLFVAAAEILFFAIVGMAYRSVDPNIVKKKIIETFLKFTE